MAEPTEMAWAAGWFEGEGCIFVRKIQRRSGSVRITLGLTANSTDEDTVLRFQDIVGCGSTAGPRTVKAFPNRKPCWRWAAVGQDALALCHNPLFISNLGARRRARSAEIVGMVISPDNPPAAGAWGDLCRRGHRFSHTNTRMYGNDRICLTCERERGVAQRLYTQTGIETPEYPFTEAKKARLRP